jgi:hypothetical protein
MRAFSSGASPDECVSTDGQALTRRTLGGTADGLRGYLATVTSAEENAFITGKVGTASAWLGGTDRGHDKDWRWTDGPEAGVSFFQQTGYNASGPNGCGSGGSSPQQVLRTTVFLADLGDFARVNAIYAEMFGEGVSPARACVEVAALPKGARVEIDAIALSA